MNKEDKQWLKKCIDNPHKYKIFVDNDGIFIVDTEKQKNEDVWGDDVVHTFWNFGYDFVVDLLEYLGTNVDYV